MSPQLRIHERSVRRPWRTALAALMVFALASPSASQAQHTWFVSAQGEPFPTADCASWENACQELQTALYLAEAGDEIWVAEGTYKPDFPYENNPTLSFELVDGVKLYGGFRGNEPDIEERAGLFRETILSGELAYVNSQHILMGEDLLKGAVVDGFTITNGRAAGSGFVNDRGGGLFLFNSILDVRNCRFVENSAWNVAGGAWVSESVATFTKCLFEDNEVFPRSQGAAIHNVFGSHVTLIDCRISGHTIGGGAIFVGGDILGNAASTLIAHRTVFIGNSGIAGGAIINNGFSTIVNSLFVGNEAFGPGTPPFAGMGGAIANFGEMSITNSTLFGNSAAVAGGGLHNGGETPNTNLDSILVASNCVLWGNVAPGSLESAQVSSDGDELTLNYCDIEGLTGDLGGLGNIGADPLFVDSFGPDNEVGTGDEFLRLSSGSPAIDSGDNTALPDEVTTDLDGSPRFVDDPDAPDTGNPDGINPIVDMGAYEFNCIDDDGDGRVTICHTPPGNADNARTITVRVNAVPAHLAHGDHCGPCQE